MVKSVSLKVPVYLLIVSCCDITDFIGQGVSQVSDEDLSQRKVQITQGKTRPLVGINYRDKMRFAFSLSFPCISVCRTEKTLKNKILEEKLGLPCNNFASDTQNWPCKFQIEIFCDS